MNFKEIRMNWIMANGIDDEPSGAQAYFTTAPPRDHQQSRPEDEPVVGNDREG